MPEDFFRGSRYTFRDYVNRACDSCEVETEAAAAIFFFILSLSLVNFLPGRGHEKPRVAKVCVFILYIIARYILI